MLQYEKILPGQGHAAGRRLLSRMYEARFGRPMPTILVTERGKPYFADGSAHFSISHTKGHVFCVLKDHPVGMDGEEADRDIDLRLADKILSPAEKLRFQKAADPRTALLKLWVLKEAAAKCSGEGLRGYPNQTDFDPDDGRVQLIDGCFVAVIQASNA